MSLAFASVEKAWRRIFKRFYKQLHIHIVGLDFEGQSLKDAILLVHHRTGEIIHILPHTKQIFLRHGHGQLLFPHHAPGKIWEDVCIDETLTESLAILEIEWGFQSKVLEPDVSP